MYEISLICIKSGNLFVHLSFSFLKLIFKSPHKFKSLLLHNLVIITPFFRGNHVTHVLKKWQLILIILHHLTLTLFKLGYEQNMEFPISLCHINVMSLCPVAPAGNNACK